MRLRPPPPRVFSGIEFPAGPANHFRFRLGPEVEIALLGGSESWHEPGAGRPAADCAQEPAPS